MVEEVKKMCKKILLIVLAVLLAVSIFFNGWLLHGRWSTFPPSNMEDRCPAYFSKFPHLQADFDCADFGWNSLIMLSYKNCGSATTWMFQVATSVGDLSSKHQGWCYIQDPDSVSGWSTAWGDKETYCNQDSHLTCDENCCCNPC